MMNRLAELLGHKQIKTIDELDLTYWKKLGDIHFNNNKLNVKFECPKDERQDSEGKIYLIATNKKIVKFGGSQTRGGIESTINAYLNGFRVGQSKRTYSIWNYLQSELKKNNNIEIWFMKLPTVRTAIPTFSGEVINIVGGMTSGSSGFSQVLNKINNKTKIKLLVIFFIFI